MSAKKRKPRVIAVLATDQQKKFVEGLGRGLSQTEAARLAYPDSKHPNNMAVQCMKSPAVKAMIANEMKKNMKIEASAVPYRVLMQICKNEDASDSNRIKAGIALHDKFGIGSLKGEDGRTMDLEDMSSSELQEFIQSSEARLLGDIEDTPAENAEFEIIEDNDVDSEGSEC